MTAAALKAPAGLSMPAWDTTAWEHWLRGRVDLGWRPGEWDAGVWLFTGNPDNPATSVVRCRTSACSAVLPGRTIRFCLACQRDWADSALPEAEFAAGHVPAGRHCSPGGAREACAVTRQDVRCARPRSSQGLCVSHYSSWRVYWRRGEPSGQQPLAAREWAATLATPYPDPPPACLVGACNGSASSRRGLCDHHLRLWWNAGKAGQAGTLQRWAAGQIAYLAGYQFCLQTLPEPLRWEVLFALQQHDAPRRTLQPDAVRGAVTELARMTVTTLTVTVPASVAWPGNKGVVGQLRQLCWAVRLGFDEFRGIKPTDKAVLDMRAVDLAAAHPHRRRRRPGTADLTVLGQPWLRRLMQRWVELEHPPARTFNQTLRAATIASRALGERPAGGHDPAALRFTDMSAVVAAIWSQTQPDGSPYAASTAANWQAVWFRLLDVGGRAGLLDDLGVSFVRDRNAHPRPRRGRHGHDNADEAGKAIPESVIAQLDTRLGALGTGPVYGRAAPTIRAEDLAAMYQTAYVLLRDTGRRPTEIVTLARDCLEQHRGEVSLLWDNHKSQRLRRRLPITTATAHAIGDWRRRRDQLVVPARGDRFLFPALTPASPDPHLASSAVSHAFRTWADALPELLTEDIDTTGNRAPFPPSRIYPYALRHSYAQRHADAGTPADVLRELMDHRSIETTAGYYAVSMKRRRHAVAALAAHVIDRHGTPAGATTGAYQLRSVAVPYGGCTEPSNIKAGGKGCPIRFQCAGCGFYRPDPSYLTAIEQHIHELRADLETAHAMDTATFVITALTEEINAYDAVAATMRTRLAELPAIERAEIEHAATMLRKIRAGAGVTLPLTVVNRATATTSREGG